MEPQPHSNALSRELELELVRVRAEASAARLEARAAELELMLLAQRPQSRYVKQESRFQESFASGHEDAAQSLISAIRHLVQQGADDTCLDAQHNPTVPVSGRAAASVGDGYQSLSAVVGGGGGWESRLSGLRGRRADPMDETASQQSLAAEGVAEHDRFADRIAMASQAVAEEPQQGKSVADSSEPTPEVAGTAVKSPSVFQNATIEPVNQPDVASPWPVKVVSQALMKPIAIPVSISEDAADQEKPKRLRPAGWLVSTTAHVVALLALGLFTLANPKPKDQLAFTASVSEASETAVESLTIESAQEMPDVAEPPLMETAADVSPLGTMKMAEVSLDPPTAVVSPITTAMSAEKSSELMKLAKAAVQGDTPSKVQFAGLDGGGNHFVYLVDSSNSMKKFNDARMELLRSIDSLKPDQRFYVVFYDENPKYMRINNPSQDESASVYATPENKQAFRRWAMAVPQARGQSPPEVLKFAFKLRPDVIFLLSDGEFTAQTETVIRQNNVQENLFGDAGPISIIHTIRYPGVSSTEGRQAEVQMQRIAAENGGQYRNIEIK